MSSTCEQCGDSVPISMINECAGCMSDFCDKCLNGQFSCEACLEEENEGEDDE